MCALNTNKLLRGFFKSVPQRNVMCVVSVNKLNEYGSYIAIFDNLHDIHARF